MKKFVVKENSTLKTFTDNVFPQGSFCLAALFRAKDIKVNGARVFKDVPLKCGDEVTYYTTPKQEEMKSHNLVYEDENVYIADKLSGVSYEGLLSELSGKGEFLGVHRLDRNTQGLIVFAKTRAAEEELLNAFAERRVIKTYIALCKNNFKKEHETLTAYLLKNEKSATVKIFNEEKRGTVKIITEYTVVEKRKDLALVRIVLHTGKTHQIRAHMAFIGCPVLGDEKYGDGELNKKYGVKRQRLISKTLAFCFDGELKYLNGKLFLSSFEL